MKTKIINGVTYTHRTKGGGYPARIICTDYKEYSNYNPSRTVLALYLTGTHENIIIVRADLTYSDNNDQYTLLEGVEPETDWSKVAVDTPVWVNTFSGWMKRHFARVEAGLIFCFDDGRTSFTELRTCGWAQASLTDPTGSTSK